MCFRQAARNLTNLTLVVLAGDDAVPVGGGGNRARGVGRRAALTAPGSARTCIIDVTQTVYHNVGT